MAYLLRSMTLVTVWLLLAGCGTKHGDDDTEVGGSGRGGSSGGTFGDGGRSGADAFGGGAGANVAGAGSQAGVNTGGVASGGRSGAGGAGRNDAGHAGNEASGAGGRSAAGGAGAGQGENGGRAASSSGGTAAGGDTAGSGGTGGKSPTACDAVCPWETTCTSSSSCPTDCLVGYSRTADCHSATEALGTCIEGIAFDCSGISTVCATQISARQTACDMSTGGGDTCAFAEDGACDEPGFCPPGTDSTDCALSNSCSLAYDGKCEEGAECAIGTDTYDCAK